MPYNAMHFVVKKSWVWKGRRDCWDTSSSKLLHQWSSNLQWCCFSPGRCCGFLPSCRCRSWIRKFQTSWSPLGLICLRSYSFAKFPDPARIPGHCIPSTLFTMNVALLCHCTTTHSEEKKVCDQIRSCGAGGDCRLCSFGFKKRCWSVWAGSWEDLVLKVSDNFCTMRFQVFCFNLIACATMTTKWVEGDFGESWFSSISKLLTPQVHWYSVTAWGIHSSRHFCFEAFTAM